MLYRITYYIEQLEDSDYVVVDTNDVDIAETRAEVHFRNTYDGNMEWIETAKDGHLVVDLLSYDSVLGIWY